MTRSVLTACLSLSLVLSVVCAPMVSAKDLAKDPTVRARMGLMDHLKDNLTIVGDMATGKAPFDARAAQAAIAALREQAAKVTDAFAEPASDPATKALPRLWDYEGEFRQKARRLQKAADADGRLQRKRAGRWAQRAWRILQGLPRAFQGRLSAAVADDAPLNRSPIL